MTCRVNLCMFQWQPELIHNYDGELQLDSHAVAQNCPYQPALCKPEWMRRNLLSIVTIHKLLIRTQGKLAFPLSNTLVTPFKASGNSDIWLKVSKEALTPSRDAQVQLRSFTYFARQKAFAPITLFQGCTMRSLHLSRRSSCILCVKWLNQDPHLFVV